MSEIFCFNCHLYFIYRFLLYLFIYFYLYILSIYIYSTFKQQKLTQSALETVQLQKPIFMLLFFFKYIKSWKLLIIVERKKQ